MDIQQVFLSIHTLKDVRSFPVWNYNKVAVNNHVQTLSFHFFRINAVQLLSGMGSVFNFEETSQLFKVTVPFYICTYNE